MSDFKIEVGKYYKTRDGYKAIIYDIFPKDNPRMINGGVTADGEFWAIRQWDTVDGRFAVDQDTALDIVSPWVDPPVVDWDSLPQGCVCCAIDVDGAANGYYDSRIQVSGEQGYWDFIDNHPCQEYIEHYCIITLSPGTIQFSGDWKDSKVMRPGVEDLMKKG